MEAKEGFNRFGHGVAIVLTIILLFASRGFLISHPWQGGFLLLAFAVFYLASTIVSRKGLLIYPLVVVFVVAYYLFAFAFGISSLYYPLLSVPIIFALYFIGKRIESIGEKQVVASLYKNGYLITLCFWIYILWHLMNYVNDNTWAAAPTLFLYSLYYLLRYLDTKRVSHQYIGLISFAGAFLFTLYGTRHIPIAYFGLFLIGLCMAMMAIGTRYHNVLGFPQVRAFYVIGQILSLAAFIYAVRDKNALLSSLWLFSIHYFGVSRSVSIKPTATRLGELLFYKTAFALAIIASGVCVVLLFAYGFPATTGAIIATLGYAIFYLRVAFGRKRTFLQSRSQYAYLFGFFLTSFYFIVLTKINPLGTMQFNMFLSIPLLIFILLYSYKTEKKAPEAVVNSFYETGYLVIATAFLLPIWTKEYAPWPALLVAALSLTVYMVFIYATKRRNLWYAIVPIFAYAYYSLLNVFSIKANYIGFFYIPLGLLAIGLAVYRDDKKGLFLTRLLYCIWFLFSAISILTSIGSRMINVVCVTIWAGAYLIATQLIERRQAMSGPVKI